MVLTAGCLGEKSLLELALLGKWNITTFINVVPVILFINLLPWGSAAKNFSFNTTRKYNNIIKI